MQRQVILHVIYLSLTLSMEGVSHKLESVIRDRSMKNTAFRQYDIRGIVGEELLIEETYDLGRAIAYYFLHKNPTCKTVAVGMDGRTHSAPIKKEVCRALVDSGMNVIFVGICPSPVLYFALHNLPVDGGLMITASHNPKEYNGIKICLGTESVWGKEIQHIAQLYKEKKYIVGNKKGSITDYPLIPTYVEWLVQHFKNLQNMNLAAVIDCGNGAAGAVIPLLIKKMGWKNITLLHEKVDGTFPNHEADPVKETNMREVKKQLEQTNAQIGVGFDGDADRMGAMLKTGVLIPGDKLLGIFAYDIVKKNPKTAVVFNVICSAALSELLEQWGARPIITAVGHSIIEEEMRKQGALLGGETSCHFFFKDRYFGYDDGIYAACRLFEILETAEIELQKLLQMFPTKITSPEFRIPCPEEKKQLIVEKVKQLFAKQPNITLLTIDGVRVMMSYGWGILRASNTQPVLSLRFESDSAVGLQQVKQDFFEVLQDDLDKDMLKQQLAV